MCSWFETHSSELFCLQFVDFSQVTPLDAFIDQSFIPDAQYVDHNGSSVDTPSQGYNMIGQW